MKFVRYDHFGQGAQCAACYYKPRAGRMGSCQVCQRLMCFHHSHYHTQALHWWEPCGFEEREKGANITTREYPLQVVPTAPTISPAASSTNPSGSITVATNPPPSTPTISADQPGEPEAKSQKTTHSAPKKGKDDKDDDPSLP